MKLQDWQREMLAVTIVYRLAECGDRIPMLVSGTKWSSMEDIVQSMFNSDLIEPTQDNQYWTLAKPGRDMLTRVCAMIDAGLNFEIFGSYNFDAIIQDDWWHPDGNRLRDQLWDPRFDPNLEGRKEDLRVAMMTWMSEKLKREGKLTESIDPKRVIYLRHLANGEYKDSSENFLDPRNIKRRFDHVEDIVRSAYSWKDLSPANEDEAFSLASAIYSQGMLQLRKEEGPSCGGCGIPLAAFGNVDQCPNLECKKVFAAKPTAPQTADEYECPKCKSVVYQQDARCGGCGARLNFSLPEGTVKETTTTTTYRKYYTVTSGTYYGYTPYGWYDPWNPTLDAIAFGVLCGAILL